MSLWKIALRSIQERGLASVLTMISMALGVMLVVAVLLIHGIVTDAFRNKSGIGYNLVVGPKGGELQLVLNSVFYLSQPIENLPYEFYLEFLTADEVKKLHNDQQLNEIIEKRRQKVTKRKARELAAMTPEQQRETLLTGEFSRGTKRQPTLAIPLCLGDYYKQYRLVGTSPKLFDELVYDADRGRKFEFATGRNFKTWTKENGFFEAVAGSTVAREYNLKIGDKIVASHGAAEGEGKAHDESGFTLVGILAPSGTPNDRAMFVNMEGFYLMAGHAKPPPRPDDQVATADDFKPDGTSPADGEPVASPDAKTENGRLSPPAARDYRADQLPLNEREVTTILVKTDTFASMAMLNQLNEGNIAQAVPPIRIIYELLDQIVAPIQWLLLIVTAMICLVSGVSILVSIYNSMNDRKHEIAVMRALGAGRRTVMAIVLMESIMLSVGGGLMGWVAGHALIAAASGQIEERTGVRINVFDFAPAVNLADGPVRIAVSPELLLVPGLILLAIIVGFLPALAAYRADVAKSLQ